LDSVYGEDNNNLEAHDYYQKQDFEGQPLPEDKRMYGFEEPGDF
jgi:hypothetical protein